MNAQDRDQWTKFIKHANAHKGSKMREACKDTVGQSSTHCNYTSCQVRLSAQEQHSGNGQLLALSAMFFCLYEPS
jgi:hypothetical protein